MDKNPTVNKVAKNKNKKISAKNMIVQKIIQKIPQNWVVMVYLNRH